jgi:uncharacterized protein (DUF934 family)
MPLLKTGHVVADPFVHIGDEDALPESGAIIVSLERFEKERDALIARKDDLGVRLSSDQTPDKIKDDLAHIAVCALEFPAFTDGRAYSYARLLRERFQYQGEIRAIGNVLLEQLHFMGRSGFDAFEVASDDAAQEWKIAEADMDVFYQQTSDGRTTAMGRRRS